MSPPDPVFIETKAAAYLGIGSRTLREKRLNGEIAYVRLSARRIGYRQSQLDAYAAARTVVPKAS